MPFDRERGRLRPVRTGLGGVVHCLRSSCISFLLSCVGCFVAPERAAIEADPVELAAGNWQTKTDAVTSLSCSRAGVLDFDGEDGTAQLSIADQELWSYVVSISADGEALELVFECQDCGTAGPEASFGAVCRFEEFATAGVGWFPSSDGLRCEVAALGAWFSSNSAEWCNPVFFGHLQRS